MYKLYAPNYESRGLPEFPKHYVETNFYETVHVTDGIATCESPYSLDLLLKMGYKLVKAPGKEAKPIRRKRLGKSNP